MYSPQYILAVVPFEGLQAIGLDMLEEASKSLESFLATHTGYSDWVQKDLHLRLVLDEIDNRIYLLKGVYPTSLGW